MKAFSSKRILVATIIGAIGICLWATETALVTFATGLPTLEIVALAFFFAALLSPFAWKIAGGGPLDAFRQPLAAWLVTVPSLVLYHACIYYAVHRVPATPAALLHGATPLFIVLGSALLPGERLRWWHLAGAGLGALGMMWLIDVGSGSFALEEGSAFYLACIGLAAGLWGVYSLVSRSFGEVPTSAMGTFYAAAALVAFIGHLILEDWVTPNLNQWIVIVLLGVLPMGLALYFWDYGIKKGDIQALGATSYVEPLIGAFLVVVLGQGEFGWAMLLAGMLIISGSILAAGNLWGLESKESGTDAIGEGAPHADDSKALYEGRLSDLRILLRCQHILNERMNELLALKADEELRAEKDISLNDLLKAAEQAKLLSEHMAMVLQDLKVDQAHHRVRSRTKLSQEQFSSLKHLAIDAIRDLGAEAA